MDSCNSGSLQSSSGNDEEYDSRATIALPPNQPMIHTLSTYFINPNTPYPTHVTPTSNPNTITSFQPPTLDTNTIRSNHAPLNTTARNPKKRSRASRRAPTTVLTTNTSNFRAMVQEFTGVPASPFTAASPYLHRPLPQKFQQQILTPSLNSVGYQQMPVITQSSNLFNFPVQTNQRFSFSNDSFVMGSNDLQSELRNNGGCGEFGYDGNDINNIKVENNFVRSGASEPDRVNGEGVAESWICANSD